MKMVEIEVESATGLALDWLVHASVTRNEIEPRSDGYGGWRLETPRYSREWAQMGPLIDAFDVQITPASTPGHFLAHRTGSVWSGEGPNRLIAAARAIANADRGPVAEVPAVLVNHTGVPA